MKREAFTMGPLKGLINIIIKLLLLGTILIMGFKYTYR